MSAFQEIWGNITVFSGLKLLIDGIRQEVYEINKLSKNFV